MKKESTDEISNVKTLEELLELYKEDKLSLAKLKTIIDIHPGIVQSSIKSFDALIEATKSAKNSQDVALQFCRESISGLNETLRILAEKSESDSNREKIAEIILEMAKIYSENIKTVGNMNKSNNRIWIRIGQYALAGLSLVAVGAVAAIFGGGKK